LPQICARAYHPSVPLRTVLERGPKNKKVVAYAIDWPGWSRGAKTADDALATLESYRVRYREIAVAAGVAKEFDATGPLVVVEDRVGTGSTDFWGISFSPSSFEQGPMDDRELDRKIGLLRACWSLFDEVAARVSAEMRKGPRGGGRDRDEIIRHTIRVESEDFAKKVGVSVAEGAALTTRGLRRYREAYVAAMRAYNAGEGKPMRSWTLPFLIRHSAFHVMDHSWEMQDKDLSSDPGKSTPARARTAHEPTARTARRERSPVQRTTARKPAARKTVAKKVPSRRTARPSGPQTSARKKAPARTATARKPAAGKPSARNAPPPRTARASGAPSALGQKPTARMATTRKLAPKALGKRAPSRSTTRRSNAPAKTGIGAARKTTSRSGSR
jgi:hypothetical protein